MTSVAPTLILRDVRTDEQGTSFFEFTIALPFLFTIIASAIQFGYALNQYMVLSDAVHQAARYAASSIRLGSNNEISNATATQTGCAGASGFSSGTGTSSDLRYHQLVQQRVVDLVSDTNPQVSSSPLCVTTGAKDGSAVAPGQRNVYVRASIQLGGFFKAFGQVPLTVEAEAPILQ